jgi:hypothetical protein
MTRLLSQQLLEHIRAIHAGEIGWEASRDAVLTEGKEAVLLLIEVLEAEIRKSQGSLVVSYKKMLRLADVLADTGDARGLVVLTHIAGLSNSDKAQRELLQNMESRTTSADRAALLATLKEFPNNIAVAETLVLIAERDPHLELRAALPLLRAGLGNPYAPLEFIGLRKRLKAVLVNLALPIPATVSQMAENLPIPSERESL